MGSGVLLGFVDTGIDYQNMLFRNADGSTKIVSIWDQTAVNMQAMILEWGIIKGNNRSMDSHQIKKYLIRGVKRNPNLTYPNREWGYGMVNIYGTFNSLRGE